MKYGETEGKKRFDNYIQNTSSFFSKTSQKLFWSIYNNLPPYIQEKTYFAELNKEFSIYDKKNKTYRKYDFVITNLHFCIEYNGDHYHANPKMYKINDIVYKKKGNPMRVWTEDKHKLDLLKERDINVILVWDSDFQENPENTIKKCIDIIQGKIDEYKKNKEI